VIGVVGDTLAATTAEQTGCLAMMLAFAAHRLLTRGVFRLFEENKVVDWIC
jgi:hypothetical protein